MHPGDLQAAHSHAFRHRAEIERSATCRCFHCGDVFEPSQITHWVDAEQTALCPGCWVDAVVGDASGIALTDAWYVAMQQHWFGCDCRPIPEKGLEALRFYADPVNWKSLSRGFELQVDPKPSPIEADRGAQARKALGIPRE